MDLVIFEKKKFINAFETGEQVEVQIGVRWKQIYRYQHDTFYRLLNNGFLFRYFDMEKGKYVYMGFQDERGNIEGQLTIGAELLKNSNDTELKKEQDKIVKSVNAEILLTFLQLCRDEWNMFLNSPSIKASSKNYIKYQLRENLAAIFRSIKNRFVQQRNEGIFELLMDMIADHADEVEDIVNDIRKDLMCNIIQSMSYDNQKPFAHAVLTYCFLHCAQIALKNITGDCKTHPMIFDSMRLIDKCPETYGWDAWKPLENVVNSELMTNICRRVVAIAEKTYNIDSGTETFAIPQGKFKVDKLVNQSNIA